MRSLVVLEGPDGCGKSSVAQALADKLEGYSMDFPYADTYTGAHIRAYLRRDWKVFQVAGDIPGGSGDEHLSALTFQALMLANRMECVPMMRRMLTEGDIFAARYWQSGWVYGGLDGLDPKWLTTVHRALPQPVLNILLDLPVEETLRRRAARDGKLPPERYEIEAKAAEIRKRYRALWVGHPGGSGIWEVVDASQPFDVVVAECYRLFCRRVRCNECGNTGHTHETDGESPHRVFRLLICPYCDGMLREDCGVEGCQWHVEPVI